LQVKKYILFLVFICCSSVFSDENTQSSVIEPNVVLTEILESYKNFSESPQKAIDTIWDNAHPSNREITGPKDRFERMLLSEPYSSILDLKEYSFTKTIETEESQHYEIKILAKNNSYFEVTWVFQLDLCLSDSENKCWLTVAVTAPSYFESGV
jgi:hypothetical protein